MFLCALINFPLKGHFYGKKVIQDYYESHRHILFGTSTDNPHICTEERSLLVLERKSLRRIFRSVQDAVTAEFITRMNHELKQLNGEPYIMSSNQARRMVWLDYVYPTGYLT